MQLNSAARGHIPLSSHELASPCVYSLSPPSLVYKYRYGGIIQAGVHMGRGIIEVQGIDFGASTLDVGLVVESLVVLSSSLEGIDGAVGERLVLHELVLRR